MRSPLSGCGRGCLTSDIGRRINVAARVSGSLDLTRARIARRWWSSGEQPTAGIYHRSSGPPNATPNRSAEPSDLDCRPARMSKRETRTSRTTVVGGKRKRATSRPDDSRPTQTGPHVRTGTVTRSIARQKATGGDGETLPAARLAYDGWPIGMEPAVLQTARNRGRVS